MCPNGPIEASVTNFLWFDANFVRVWGRAW